MTKIPRSGAESQKSYRFVAQKCATYGAVLVDRPQASAARGCRGTGSARIPGRLKRKGTGGCISVAPPTIPFATELFCFVRQVAGPGGLPAKGVWIVTGTQACRCNRYSYSTPSRCSPAAFQPADLSHLTLGGNSPFALSVPPRPLAAKLLNLEARNYLNLRWEICKRT